MELFIIPRNFYLRSFMKKGIVFGLIFWIASSAMVQAQVNVRDSAQQGWIFNIHLGGYLNGGDISNLYGNNLAVGLDIMYKTKSNWVLGVGGSFLFGNDVKNQAELLQDLLTDGGNIIGVDGDYADVRFYQRGYNIMAKAGKIFPFIGPNPNSGMFVQLGVGYLRHRTLIENKSQSVPQLLNDYAKGYDRLHGGLLLNQYIGLYYSGNKRTTNFTVGLDFQQGFTTNYRQYNYSTRQYDTETKLDLFYGLKVSWFIPIYDKNAQKFYYY